MTTKSEKFLQTATKLLAEQFQRLGKVSYEDSLKWAEEIIPVIDWENEALMHKGFSWIAKQYIGRMVA